MNVKIDLSYLENMSGGDKSLMMEMIEIFKEQVPEFVTEMNSSFDYQDWKTLASVAHKAKSSIAIIGLTDLIEELKKFETNVIQLNEISGFKIFIQHFEKTCNQAITQLNIIISQY